MKILISRELAADSVFLRYASQAGATVLAQSFITLTPVAFEIVQEAQWLFFSSKNAVRFFFDGGGKVGNHKLGAVGKSTAAALHERGWPCNFVGDARDTTQVATTFRGVVGNDQVIFPISSQSLRTVQGALPRAQVQDVEVYQTELAPPVGLENDADVLVFTSPSNVRSFFSVQGAQPGQQIVAIGRATAAELARHGQQQYHLPTEPTEQALLALIFSL